MDQIDTQPVASPTKAQGIARILLATALGLLGLWIVWGFVPALVWALVIAVAGLVVWMRVRKRAMWWPRHVQGRWASVGWILAAGVMGVGVMVEGL